MSQSKKDSIKEVACSTAIGMIGSFLITMVCLSLFTSSIGIAISSTIFCTAWSIGRGYCIRRYFNNKLEVQIN